MRQIKLLIWDMDETFWEGTLSEGKINKKEKNIEIVRTLVDRGIMNSIVSKNDLASVLEVLKKWEIDDLFIFPMVSWNPKGEMVKQLLDLCGLRAENVAFVDDNNSNLEEVKYYNPGIKCFPPEQLETILDDADYIGKLDSSHERLKQYHILERKQKQKEVFSSNEEFLRKSHICIEKCKNCLEEIDRIEELIQRTNQLNYTKVRSSRQELKHQLQSPGVEAAYIKAKDDFGEYGIVGFYLLQDDTLIHFLFSCRILGMGIENYVYKSIGAPQFTIVGDTRTALDMDVDWIAECKSDSKSHTHTEINTEKLKILMIGGCDLEGACAYVPNDWTIEKEFATVINGYPVRTSDSRQLKNILELTENEKYSICKNIPFYNMDVSFGSKIYSGNYDVIIWSVVDDYIRAIWSSKNNPDLKIGFGGYHDLNKCLGKFEKEDIRYLLDNFEYIGPQSNREIKDNIMFVLDHISSETKVILINGNEVDVSDWIGDERIHHNIDKNKVIDEVVELYENVQLLDMREIVLDRNAFDISVHMDNRHYTRDIFYLMANKIIELIDG